MKWSHRLALFTALAMMATSLAPAKAPKSKDVMQPVDTAAGTFTDPNRLFKVNLGKPLSLGLSGQPVQLAYDRLHAILGVEWGFSEGVDPNQPVSFSASGTARNVLHAIGVAAGVRFEAVGPTQLRVVKARASDTVRKPPTEPPPLKSP